MPYVGAFFRFSCAKRKNYLFEQRPATCQAIGRNAVKTCHQKWKLYHFRKTQNVHGRDIHTCQRETTQNATRRDQRQKNGSR